MEIKTPVENLNRPHLLVRAARFRAEEAMRGWNSKARRFYESPTDAGVLKSLIRVESKINDLRLRKSAEYSLEKHVVQLGALIIEANRLKSQLQVVT